MERLAGKVMLLSGTRRALVAFLAGLVGVLALYVGLIGQFGAQIAQLPVLAQMVVYIALGTVWLLPLRRFLIWMETGRWG